jgi:carboxylesterase
MTAPTIPGAEPFSHVGSSDVGVLVLHGFTGNPGSMRGLAEACAAAGFHVELPQLAGHGTIIEEMIPTRWADWSGDAEKAYQVLLQRATKIVVMGLSMGGALTLWMAAEHPELKGIVCVNPATQPQPVEVLNMVQEMIDSGVESTEAIGSDIADPDVHETAYGGTPLAAMHSFLSEGLAPLAPRYSSIKMPMLLFTSIQDHVVQPSDSDAVAAVYGGPVQRVMLERSYHVATQDYDKDIIFEGSVAFVQQVTS